MGKRKSEMLRVCFISEQLKMIDPQKSENEVWGIQDYSWARNINTATLRCFKFNFTGPEYIPSLRSMLAEYQISEYYLQLENAILFFYSL